VKAVRIGRWAAGGAVLGALLWVAGFFGFWNYEGDLPAWVDMLLVAGALIVAVSVLTILGSAVAIMAGRAR
jgi:uncharacterized membrane protein YGL010W